MRDDLLGVCMVTRFIGPQHHYVRLDDGSGKLARAHRALLTVGGNRDITVTDWSLRKGEDTDAQDQKQSFHLPDLRARLYRWPGLTNAPRLDTLV